MKLDKMALNFIWQNKYPKIAKEYFIKRNDMGRLLPFAGKMYYTVTSLSSVRVELEFTKK